jgi:hypothetical protein
VIEMVVIGLTQKTVVCWYRTERRYGHHEWGCKTSVMGSETYEDS